MPTSPPCHIIALLGLSPAVITQLAWHLAVREKRTIASVQLWTTCASTDPYAGSVQLSELRRMWSKLRIHLGSQAVRIPASIAPEDVHLFGSGDQRLADVTTTEEQQVVTEQLDLAVRARVSELPPDEPLIGGIAGGRKPMSGAMLLAFTLRGRPIDRLVYVGLHPSIDRRKFNTAMEAYAFPTEEWAEFLDLPVNGQVYAYDVGVPPLTAILHAKGGVPADVHARGRAVRNRHNTDGVSVHPPLGGRRWIVRGKQEREPAYLKRREVEVVAHLLNSKKPQTHAAVGAALKVSGKTAHRYLMRATHAMRCLVPENRLPRRDTRDRWLIDHPDFYDWSTWEQQPNFAAQ